MSRSPGIPKPPSMEKAVFPPGLPRKWERQAGQGGEVVMGTSRPLLPHLFTSLGRCQLVPILVKVLCWEHLSTRIWPGPKSISQGTPNSCQMVPGLDGNQRNTILLATGEAGPLGRRGPSPYSPTPDAPVSKP